MKPVYTKLLLVVLFLFFVSSVFAQVLDITPSPVTFGIVHMGNMDTRIVTIGTAEAGGIEITNVTLAGDLSFEITSMPARPFMVLPTASVEIEITYTPSVIGFATAVLQVTPSGFPVQFVDVNGTGEGSGSPDMITYPGDYDFGTVDLGSVVSTELLVRLSPEWLATHAGGEVINATLIGSADFSSGATLNTATNTAVAFPFVMSAADEISFEIFYSPSDDGDDNAVIEIQTSDSRLYQIFLTGNCIMPTPQINLDPNSVVMELPEGTMFTSFFDIQNTGTDSLHFNINAEELPTWLTLSRENGTVAIGSSMRINVTADATDVIADNFSYFVYVASDDPDNPSITLMITVVVTTAPLVANFTAAPLSGHPPFIVSFTDTSHRDPDDYWVNINSWAWDFNNDGVFDSYLQNPSYTYTLPGAHSVLLVVTTNTGAVSQRLRENYIVGMNSSPQIVSPLTAISMTEDTQYGPSGITYIFNDPDGDPVIITCEGSEHLNAIVEFGYLRIIPSTNWHGTETIRLRAVDRFGKGPIQNVVVTVASVNDAPILSVPADLYFIRNSHYTVDFSPYINDPDNADAQLSLQIIPTFAGPITFQYTPNPLPNVVGQLSVMFTSLSQVTAIAGFTLQVNDNMGRLIASAPFTMHVLEQFTPQINLTSTYQYAGQTVEFKDATLGNPDYWLWEFGNGQTSTLQNPSYQYMQAGTYDIRLTLGNTEADESAMVFIPAMIHLVGTAISDTALPGTWTLQGSPYNLYGDVVVGETTNIVIEDDVLVNMFGEAPLEVLGSLNATGAVFQPQTGSGFWGGLRFRGDNQRNPSELENCQIIDALLPVDIEGQNPSFNNLQISVSDTTNYSDGAAVKIANSSSTLNGVEILNYLGGLEIEAGNGSRTTPTLTNIRIRNSTSSLRLELPPSTALTINGEAIVNGLVTDNFSIGVSIGTETLRTTATPTLTNIRVRNSSNTTRAVTSGTGMTIRGNAAPILNDVEIEEVATGILLENVNSTTRTTPTLTNIRVRNSSNTQRSLTNGVIIRNTPTISITDAEILDFTTGILMQTDTRTTSTPTLTNIRVRNSSNTLRTASTGIIINGSVIARLDDVEVEFYNTGISYVMDGAIRAQGTPTLTNIRIRNSSSTQRNETIGAVFSGITKLNINDMHIDYCSTGLKLLAPDAQTPSLPTLSNIIVRNNILRTETTGIYLGSGVRGSLSGCVVDSTDIGIMIADGNRTVLDNNRLVDCKTGIRATGTNPLPIRRQVFLLQYPFDNYKAMELFGSGPWTVCQNTIYKYPIGVKATNADLNFHSNILWNDDMILPIPFQNAGSTISNSYNNIYYGMATFPGLGNINANPCFAAAADQDFAILRDSPCIDAGNPALPREADGSIADIGAMSYLHRASATATPRFIVAGTTVNFTNTSLGHGYPDSQIEWDIGNDSITDYTSQTFSHLFTTPGLYDVRLRLQSGLLVDETIYERFIVVSTNQLPAPANPTLTRDGNDIIFNWDAVIQRNRDTEVPFYIVFKSDTPDGFYYYRGFSTSSLIPFRDSGAALADKAFYMVIGFDGSRAELMQYIERQLQREGIRSKQ